MDTLVYVTLLFDRYGELLTKKQQDVFEDYYHDNLSLREIAEKYDISPQGVRDNLKRSEKLLFGYEDKLSLLKEDNHRAYQLEQLINEIGELQIEENTKKKIVEKINLIIRE